MYKRQPKEREQISGQENLIVLARFGWLIEAKAFSSRSLGQFRYVSGKTGCWP